MPKTRIPGQQRFIFDDVSWDRYTRLLKIFSRPSLRLTYDRGFLEVMTLSHKHEGLSRFLGRLLVAITEELSLPIKGGGSTTFRRKRKQTGLEADDCYWIAHEAAVRDKERIDLRFDPPPDVAIEIDIAHSSMDRMSIYASLRFPVIWRYDATGLAFFTLNAKHKYTSASVSAAFPLAITPGDLMPFIQRRGRIDENAIIRKFREWLRSKIQASP